MYFVKWKTDLLILLEIGFFKVNIYKSALEFIVAP